MSATANAALGGVLFAAQIPSAITTGAVRACGRALGALNDPVKTRSGCRERGEEERERRRRTVSGRLPRRPHGATAFPARTARRRPARDTGHDLHALPREEENEKDAHAAHASQKNGGPPRRKRVERLPKRAQRESASGSASVAELDLERRVKAPPTIRPGFARTPALRRRVRDTSGTSSTRSRAPARDRLDAREGLERAAVAARHRRREDASTTTQIASGRASAANPVAIPVVHPLLLDQDAASP